MAARTYQNLIDEARALLQDSVNVDGDLRFTESFLVDQLNRGLEELGRIRPDAFYDTFDANQLNVPKVVPTGATPDTAINEAALSAAFPLDAMFYQPLVSWTVGMAEVTDDEFTLDNRAGLLISDFRNRVVST